MLNSSDQDSQDQELRFTIQEQEQFPRVSAIRSHDVLVVVVLLQILTDDVVLHDF